MSCNGNESCYTKKQGGLSEMVQPEDGQVCVLDNKEQMTWVFEPHEWIWGVARSLSHLDVAYRKPHTPRSTIIWFPSANYGNHMFALTDEGWEHIKAILKDDHAEADPAGFPVVDGPADWTPEQVRRCNEWSGLIVGLPDTKDELEAWTKMDDIRRAEEKKDAAPLPKRWAEERIARGILYDRLVAEFNDKNEDSDE